MGNTELDVVTKGDLIEFEQRMKLEMNIAIKEKLDKNNETLIPKLMTKIEKDLFYPLIEKFEYIGSLVTFQDVNKKWVSKSVKNYLGIRIKGESKYEYDSIILAYKAKLRVVTNKPITRLEDIPQTIENIKLLDDVCRFMYPKECNRGKLFKN